MSHRLITRSVRANLPYRIIIIRSTPSSATRSSASMAPQSNREISMAAKVRVDGDLNNTEVLRKTAVIAPDAAYSGRSLAMLEADDDVNVRAKYRPFLQPNNLAYNDWVAKLELSTVIKAAQADLQQTGGDRLKVVILYGSLRSRSYSRLLAFECARILFRLGCDVRVFDPDGLPVKNDVDHEHHKVQELRNLSRWSDGHVWVSPEQHGNLVRFYNPARPV